MIAYHGKPDAKAAILAQLRAHAAADELIKGKYWEDGKGCAVGCTIHSGEHAEYEPRFGIPQTLARLEDSIFEGLPNGEAKRWPVDFMESIPVGADLSLVGWKFLHWLLTDKTVNPGIDHPLVRDAVRKCADVLAPLTKGEPADSSAARSAYSAARSAAYSAAYSADSADSAADSARSARSARSAYSAADSAAYSAAYSAADSAADSAARSAYSAARSAAYSAAYSARSAYSAARSAAWRLMAAKLIALCKAAAPVETREPPDVKP
jgi:hypothetical protein